MADALTADRRIYADRAGNLVEPDDPNRHTLIAGGPGIVIPAHLVEQYGLTAHEGRVYGRGQEVPTAGAQEAENGQEGARAASDAQTVPAAPGAPVDASAAREARGEASAPKDAEEKDAGSRRSQK